MRLEALCEEGAAAIELPLARDAMGIWRSDWRRSFRSCLTHGALRPIARPRFTPVSREALCDQALAVREQTEWRASDSVAACSRTAF